MSKKTFQISPETILNADRSEIHGFIKKIETSEEKVEYCEFLIGRYKSIIEDLKRAREDEGYLPATKNAQKSSFYKDRQEIYYILTLLLDSKNKHNWFRAREILDEELESRITQYSRNYKLLKQEYKHYASLLLYNSYDENIPSFKVKSSDTDVVRVFEAMVNSKIIEQIKNPECITKLFNNKKGQPFSSTNYNSQADKLIKHKPKSNSKELFDFVKIIIERDLKSDQIEKLSPFLDKIILETKKKSYKN